MLAAMTSNRVPSSAEGQSGLDDVFFREQAKGRSRMGNRAMDTAAPGSVSVKTTVTVWVPAGVVDWVLIVIAPLAAE
jgi:hypothetical protein